MEIRDPQFMQIIDGSATFEKVATGFDFLEGPVWHPQYESLIFSDILGNSIFSWRADAGVQKRSRHSYMANGNAYDRDGRLLTCEHATSRVSRTDLTNGAYEVLATHYEGRELNSPNDIVVRSDGLIYFTDPTAGRSEAFGVPREPQLPFSGVYLIHPQTGLLSLLDDSFHTPNGLCFSRDEALLYVNDSTRQHIRIFDVMPDGTIANGRHFADLTGDKPGVADGIKVDSQDNVYSCGPGGIHIFTAAGECLGVIETPERAANIVFGDSDLRSLYITATGSLYRLRVRVAGHPTYASRR